MIHALIFGIIMMVMAITWMLPLLLVPIILILGQHSNINIILYLLLGQRVGSKLLGMTIPIRIFGIDELSQ
jgi:hypothetical protein